VSLQDDDSQGHSDRFRAGRYSESRACYSITKCVDGRKPILASDEVFSLLRDTLMFLRSENRIRLLGFCVMPDHLHLLFVLVGNSSLSDVMKSFSRFTARKINEHFGRSGCLWQEGFYDHRCRDEKEIEELLAYIEHNPVRAHLVERAELWPYSSANPACAGLLDRDWYRQ
jgi:putative transposase